MASTFTSRNKLEKQGFAENSDLWGVPKLNAVFDRIDQAMDGFVVVGPSLVSTGPVTIPIRADLIPTFGSTQPGYTFTIDTGLDPLSVHRRGIRVTRDAPVRVLQLPVVEKIWFIIVEPPADDVLPYYPFDFAYISNGVDHVMPLAPGVWCVMSTAAGTLRASNLGTVRVDAVRMFSFFGTSFDIRPEFDKQHGIIVSNYAAGPLVLGANFTTYTAQFFYYPGWSMTLSNTSGADIPLVGGADPLRGLNQVGPVEGLSVLPSGRSCRILWAGTKWIVM